MADLHDEIVRLLSDLVRIDSVNPELSRGGAGEAAIARFVVDWAERHGLHTELVGGAGHGTHPADGQGTADTDRPSVLVRSRAPRPNAPTLLLCGHLDTVGLGAMADPLEPRLDGDRLYGRGAYDMKAGLTAALVAAREIARSALDLDVIVAAVADEEHASLGVQRALDALEPPLAGRGADAPIVAVVAEPTEMEIGIAHKGFLWSEIEVQGIAAHGSRPQLGVDAIVKTGPLLGAVADLGRRLASRTHPLLGAGTVHAGVISGGQEPSTIPERCVLTIERRTLPGETPADVEAEIADLLASCAAADRDFRATAHTLMHRPPLQTPADHPLVTALSGAVRAVRGAAAPVSGMSYWADSAFIAERGIPTVLFGPGGDGAHGDIEWASIGDTVDAARILVELARALASPASRT